MVAKLRNNIRYMLMALLAFLISACSILPLWSNAQIEMSHAVVYIVLFACVMLFPLLLVTHNSLAEGKGRSIGRHKAFLLSFIILIASGSLFLLLAWPGHFSTDSHDIYLQAVGSEVFQNHFRYEGLSNHHPVIYTLALRFIIWITGFIHNVTISIGIFAFLQMVFCSACSAWIIAWAYKRGCSKSYLCCALLFFSANPIVLNYSVTIWKDVPFAYVFVILVLQLSDMVSGNSREPVSRIKTIHIVVSIILLCFLRNNGIYIALLCLIATIILLPHRRVTLGVPIGITLVAILVVQGPIYSAMGIEKGHFSESVGIPLQQIAAVISSEGEITEADREFLDNILPLEDFASAYNPIGVNPIKFHENFNDDFLEAHKNEFLVTWLKLMPSNISIYLKAWINETSGYWSLRSAGYAYIPNGSYDEMGGGISDEAFWSPYEINEVSSTFPLLSNCGVLFWLAVILTVKMAYDVISKRFASSHLLPLIPYVGLLGTLLIAAPVSGEFRYLFPILISIPVFPLLFMKNRRHILKEKRTNTRQIPA